LEDRWRDWCVCCRMIYFTSDTHFSDPRVLAIDRRPFSSRAEHDEALIDLWNATVLPDDELWHLGDFMWARQGEPDMLLRRLNGRKHLIIGNNDPDTVTRATGWASVQHYAEIRIDGQMLVLCHYPFRTWNQMGRKSMNLHGHSHGRLKPMPRQFDVGVDAREFRPATLEDLTAGRRGKTSGGGGDGQGG
jgi:calcineurin-like phosphoesterase family protein